MRPYSTVATEQRDRETSAAPEHPEIRYQRCYPLIFFIFPSVLSAHIMSEIKFPSSEQLALQFVTVRKTVC